MKTKDTDWFRGTVILNPDAGGRWTNAHWYRDAVLGAVEFGQLTIQSDSVEAFRQAADLCTQVAARMEQMYAQAAQATPPAPEGREESSP